MRGKHTTSKHNTDVSGKVALRRLVVDEMGGGANCRVWEAYAGPGTMRELAWHDCARVEGSDTDIASVAEHHGDASRVLRSIDVDEFNVFDLDAFGEPYRALWTLSRRVTVRPVGVLMTNGNAVLAHLAPTARALGWSQQMCGVVGNDVNPYRTNAGRIRLMHELVSAWIGTPDRWAVKTNDRGMTIYAAAVIHSPSTKTRG